MTREQYHGIFKILTKDLKDCLFLSFLRVFGFGFGGVEMMLSLPC